MTRSRTLITIIGSAALTMALGFGAFVPRTTHADDDSDRMGEYTGDGFRFGDVIVSSELKRDEKSKTGYVLVVTAKNDSDNDASQKVEFDVTRSMSSPMSRVSAPGVAVWKHTESFKLAAHTSATHNVAIPSAVAQQMIAADRERVQREKAQNEAMAKAEKTGKYDAMPKNMYAPLAFFGVTSMKAHA
jgi:hypothetical protein